MYLTYSEITFLDDQENLVKLESDSGSLRYVDVKLGLVIDYHDVKTSSKNVNGSIKTIYTVGTKQTIYRDLKRIDINQGTKQPRAYIQLK